MLDTQETNTPKMKEQDMKDHNSIIVEAFPLKHGETRDIRPVTRSCYRVNIWKTRPGGSVVTDTVITRSYFVTIRNGKLVQDS